MDPTGQERALAESKTLGFAALFVTLCALVVLALLARRLGRPDLGERAQPPVADTPATVPGWSAALEMPDGGRLEVRLLPMHAEPERQHFEALVVARRFVLDVGEPWRLNLSWRAAGEAADAGAGATTPDSIDLSALTIVDESGVALRTFAPPPAAEGRPADPVAVLLTPPRVELGPGEAVSLILWGRAPAASPRLVGSPTSSLSISLVQSGLVATELAHSLVLVARSPVESAEEH
jgi:hypothetical protein